MDMSSSKLWDLLMNREVWRAEIHRVTKSQTQLNWTEKVGDKLRKMEETLKKVVMAELKGNQKTESIISNLCYISKIDTCGLTL